MHTRIHTQAHIHTHPRPHTHTCTPAYTHKHTRMRETYESKPLPPQAPPNTTRPINPPSRKPFADQLIVLTPTRTALTDEPAYSHECYPLPTKVPPLSFLSRTHAQPNPSTLSLSHTLSLTYASASHPRISYFNSVLPRTRARNRAPPKRRRAPPDSRNSRRYDWRDASALGPRAVKLAPFLREFSEPPKEATEWESAPSVF
jgi:hypothetical protein